MTILLLAAALAASQPASPPLGARTVQPEAVLNQLGLAPDDDDLAAAVAAANAHPLGTLENPVRVGGPTGERAYIARLRCSDGNTPQVGQRGSMGVGAFGTIVDGFLLDCGSAAPGKVTLIMDMYHSEHAENRAPPGFTIQPR